MSGTAIRLAIVGLGKIARDRHVPAVAADAEFDLVATVDPGSDGIGLPHFTTFAALLASGPEVDAVAVCTPPQVRHQVADAALTAGLHVLLEKPPASGLSEVAALETRAVVAGVTLFAAWHSRFAAGVAPARAWLADRRVTAVSIVWREDVRVWHPGQAWIFRAGGLGVFDPAINALSILTHILPGPIRLAAAELDVPANREAPIAARLTMHDGAGAPIAMDADFRQTGPQIWTIAVDTDAGRLVLADGGAVLTLPTETQRGEDREYAEVYARFAELVRAGRSEVDTTPLRLVADAFLCGTRRQVAPFDD